MYVCYSVINYFLRFPARVDDPATECCVTAFDGVLGLEVSEAEPGDEVSKLNLKREEREGVEGAVAADLLPIWSQKCI